MADNTTQAAPAPTEIRRELTQVLSGREFQASTQLNAFLRYVVGEELAGRGEGIKERNIAIAALGRAADFDPRLDCIVRVSAGRLRRALERYYAGAGAANPLRFEIPKGTYRPVIRCAEAPAGVPTASAGPLQSPAPPVIDRCPAGYPVVAVVPFVTFTRGDRERYIAESTAMGISIGLSAISWIRVIDYLATRSLPGKRYSPREIAARMRAGYYLTGTVRRRNPDGYSVTASLARTDNAVLIWAREFHIACFGEGWDRPESLADRVVVTIGDLFGVLARALWSATRQKPVEELSAVEAVLRQLHYQQHLDDGMYGETLRAVEHAVRVHPDFAWGWAALATLYLDDVLLLSKGGAADSKSRFRECLHRAQLADPACAYAHWNAGLYELIEGRIDESIEGMQRTLEHARGSPFEVGAAAAALNVAGEVQQGQPLIAQALQINPRLPGWTHWGTTFARLARGDYRAALASTERFSMPNCFWDPMLRAMALAGIGETDRTLVRRAIHLRPELAKRPRELGGMLIKQPHVLDQFVDCIHAAAR